MPGRKVHVTSTCLPFETQLILASSACRATGGKQFKGAMLTSHCLRVWTRFLFPVDILSLRRSHSKIQNPLCKIGMTPDL